MSEALSNRLPLGGTLGHDEKFVSEVEHDYQCLICYFPLKDPVLTRCGHRFCKECLVENMRRQEIQAKPFSCPADRIVLDRELDVFPDKPTERKILSLEIKCPSENCHWTGELRNKQDHLTSCPFQMVRCIYCRVALKMKDLEEHKTVTCEWRMIECEHCREPHPKYLLEVHINEKCGKFPTTCPNGCGDLIPREIIPDHIEKDCPQTLVSCPYVQMGCDEKVKRDHVETHLQTAMREHLDYLEKKVVALQKQVENKRDTEIVLMEKRADNMRVFIWKIKEFSKIFSEAKAGEKAKIESEPFCTENYGYKFKLAVYPNGSGIGKNTHLSVFIVVMKGEYDAILPWPLNEKVRISMIEQQGDLKQRVNVQFSFTANKEPFFIRPKTDENAAYGRAKFMSHEQLQRMHYLVDDTLFIQVEICLSKCPVSRTQSC